MRWFSNLFLLSLLSVSVPLIAQESDVYESHVVPKKTNPTPNFFDSKVQQAAYFEEIEDEKDKKPADQEKSELKKEKNKGQGKTQRRCRANTHRRASSSARAGQQETGFA